MHPKRTKQNEQVSKFINVDIEIGYLVYVQLEIEFNIDICAFKWNGYHLMANIYSNIYC